MQDQYILALDQGTTSSRAMVFDHDGNVVSMAQKEFQQIYPQPGWVEHDPQEIWSTQAGVAAEAVTRAGMNGTSIAAIGITNQRETTVVWDRETGQPVYNAIVWQDRRTADFCDQLKAQGLRGKGPRENRPADRFVFLRHQDPLDSRQRGRCAREGEAGTARVRHGRQLAGVEFHRGASCISPT